MFEKCCALKKISVKTVKKNLKTKKLKIAQTCENIRIFIEELKKTEES